MLYSWVSEPLRLMVVDRWVPTRSAEICGQGVVQRHHEFMVVVRPCPWWDFKRRLQAALLVLSSPPDAQLGILLAVSLLRHLVIGALIQQYFTRCPLLSLRIIWSFSLCYLSWPVEVDVPFLKWKKRLNPCITLDTTAVWKYCKRKDIYFENQIQPSEGGHNMFVFFFANNIFIYEEYSWRHCRSWCLHQGWEEQAPGTSKLRSGWYKQLVVLCFLVP